MRKRFGCAVHTCQARREPNAPNERINLPLRAVPFDSQWRSLLLRELERGGWTAAKARAPAPSPLLRFAGVFESRRAQINPLA